MRVLLHIKDREETELTSVTQIIFSQTSIMLFHANSSIELYNINQVVHCEAIPESIDDERKIQFIDCTKITTDLLNKTYTLLTDSNGNLSL